MPKGTPIQHTYSDDDLRAAFEHARSWREVERRLGLPHSTTVTRKLRETCLRLGLPVEKIPGKALRYDDEMLRAAVADSFSHADVIRHLGLALAGGNHAHIARRVRALGVDISHFNMNAYRRGGWSSIPRRQPEEFFVVLPPGSGRTASKLLRRALIETGTPEVCSGCGCGPEWMGRFLRLVVDHVDGNWHNNLRENLRFLCPNCHAQTPTFCRYRRLNTA